MLLDEIIEQNKKSAGRGAAGGESSPQPRKRLAVVTCSDCRLVDLLEKALGIGRGDAVVVKVAGAAIAPECRDVLRSLAVAVFYCGVREILVVGHRNCLLASISGADAAERLSKAGIRRDSLGDLDVRGFFGAFGSPADSVAETVKAIRSCPFIPEGVAVHGLLIDEVSGAVEVVERGYGVEKSKAAAAAAGASPLAAASTGALFAAAGPVDFKISHMAFTSVKEYHTEAEKLEHGLDEKSGRDGGSPVSQEPDHRALTAAAYDTRAPLSAQLRGSLNTVRTFCLKELKYKTREAVVNKLRDEYQKGRPPVELFKVFVQPVIALGQKRQAVMGELLQIKEEAEKLNPRMAYDMFINVLK